MLDNNIVCQFVLYPRHCSLAHGQKTDIDGFSWLASLHHLSLQSQNIFYKFLQQVLSRLCTMQTFPFIPWLNPWKIFSVLDKQQCCHIWPLEPNILTETGFVSCKKKWEGCLTIPSLSYRTEYQFLAGLNANMLIPQQFWARHLDWCYTGNELSGACFEAYWCFLKITMVLPVTKVEYPNFSLVFIQWWCEKRDEWERLRVFLWKRREESWIWGCSWAAACSLTWDAYKKMFAHAFFIQ